MATTRIHRHRSRRRHRRRDERGLPVPGSARAWGRCTSARRSAALGGLDALVFTGGIGEHAAAVREQVCARSAWLGIEIDPAANASDNQRLDRPGSRTAVWVLPTNEELVIARHTRRLVLQR